MDIRSRHTEVTNSGHHTNRQIGIDCLDLIPATRKNVLTCRICNHETVAFVLLNAHCVAIKFVGVFVFKVAAATQWYEAVIVEYLCFKWKDHYKIVTRPSDYFVVVRGVTVLRKRRCSIAQEALQYLIAKIMHALAHAVQIHRRLRRSATRMPRPLQQPPRRLRLRPRPKRPR